MDLTLYDIRSLYMLYKVMSTDSFLYNIGCLQLLDALESDAEKVELIDNTLKLFAGIDAVVEKGPEADRNYMLNPTIKSDAREKAIRAARQKNKSITVSFSYFELYTNIAVKYFHCNTIAVRLPNVTPQMVIRELGYLMKYFKDSTTRVSNSTESLLTELNVKRAELSSLRQLSEDMTFASTAQKKETAQALITEIGELDKNLKALREEMQTTIKIPIKQLGDEVSTSLIPLTKSITEIKEEIEETTMYIGQMGSDIVESIETLKSFVIAEPNTTLLRELRGLHELLSTKVQDNSSLTKELQETSLMIDSIKGQLHAHLKNRNNPAVELQTTMHDMLVRVSSLTELVDDLNSLQRMGEGDVLQLLSKVDNMKIQLETYKKKVFATNEVISTTNRKLYV